MAEPSDGAETLRQRPNAEVWQLWSNSPYCQVENRAWLPPPLFHSSFLPILPVLAEGSRRNCSSIVLNSRIATALRTEETVLEWQMHTSTNSSDKWGDIGARYLWSASSHYSKENKVINTPVPLCPAHPTPNFHSWSQLRNPELLMCTALHLGAGAALRLQGLRNLIAQHIVPWEWCPETEVV